MKTMILCAPGLEECEALMTFDLLKRAGIETDLVGLSDTITSSHGLHFTPDRLIEDIDPEVYDCLVLPGGMPGTKNLENSERVQSFIDLFLKEGKLVAAICAAPSILLHKGLLKDREFTVFPGFESGLIPSDKKAVKTGNIITAKGLGAVHEFACLIISSLINEEKAQEVLKQIQYL